MRVDASGVALHEGAAVEAQPGKRLPRSDRVEPLVRHSDRVAATRDLLELRRESGVDAADRADQGLGDGRIEVVPHLERLARETHIHRIPVREADDALPTV